MGRALAPIRQGLRGKHSVAPTEGGTPITVTLYQFTRNPLYLAEPGARCLTPPGECHCQRPAALSLCPATVTTGC